MEIKSATFHGRRGWHIANDQVALTVLEGGGHLACLHLAEGPSINPFWVPPWKTMDPWAYNARRHDARYEGPLQASICGHNLCLGWFGAPSEAEEALGLGAHGEASVARWKAARRQVSKRVARLVLHCDMPASGMELHRTITLREGSRTFHVEEKLTSHLKRDLPYTMCQHVTLGPPFLEKGVTAIDMSSKRGHTFPETFSAVQRLKTDAAFKWPKAPGAHGRPVDLRTIPARVAASSDFSAQLMDPHRDDAWFAALNPRQGLLLAYLWDRTDFPWLGNWEENHARRNPAWDGKTLARGLEFANTPFPISLREAVTRGRLFKERTYDWLPARGNRKWAYSFTFRRTPDDAKAVREIRREGMEITPVFA